jgi:hypothetical protein
MDTKVKIFSSHNRNVLENEINKFLKGPITYIDSKYHTVFHFHMNEVEYSALIIYKEYAGG